MARARRLIIRDDPAKSGYLRKPGLSSGGGGLVGTASDYLRFLLMIANDGEWNGKRLLSPESVALMRTNQLPKGVDWIGFGDDQRKGVGFGLGFSVTVEPGDKDRATTARTSTAGAAPRARTTGSRRTTISSSSRWNNAGRTRRRRKRSSSR